MNNIDKMTEFYMCTGCMACVTSCPKGALAVKKGKLGFPVPEKHPDCDNCGACLTACPALSDDDDEDESR